MCVCVRHVCDLCDVSGTLWEARCRHGPNSAPRVRASILRLVLGFIGVLGSSVWMCGCPCVFMCMCVRVRVCVWCRDMPNGVRVLYEGPMAADDNKANRELARCGCCTHTHTHTAGARTHAMDGAWVSVRAPLTMWHVLPGARCSYSNANVHLRPVMENFGGRLREPAYSGG